MSMFIDPQDEHEVNQRNTEWGNEENFEKEMFKSFEEKQVKFKRYERIGNVHRIALGRTGVLGILVCLVTGAGTIGYAVIKGALILLTMIGL